MADNYNIDDLNKVQQRDLLNRLVDLATSIDSGSASNPTEATPVKIVKTVTTASTAVPLTTVAGTYAKAVYLQAKLVAGDNTGNVFIGLSDLDQGVAELFELVPGQEGQLIMPAGTMVDLSDIYIDADTNADGVVGWYIPD